MQEPWTFPRGGKERSRLISLEAMVCQTLSGIQYMARPITRALLPTITGMFGTLKHVNRGYFDLCYHLGMTIRWVNNKSLALPESANNSMLQP